MSHPKYKMWLPPGEHIELDEDPEEALLREVKEETGLEVKILPNKPDFDVADAKAIFTPNFVDVHEANQQYYGIVYFMKTYCFSPVLNRRSTRINGGCS